MQSEKSEGDYDGCTWPIHRCNCQWNCPRLCDLQRRGKSGCFGRVRECKRGTPSYKWNVNMYKSSKAAWHSPHWQVTTSGLGAALAGGSPSPCVAGRWISPWHSANTEASEVLCWSFEKEGESPSRWRAKGEKLYR